MRNLREQVKKAFCYQNLFWPFTVLINCSSGPKKFANSQPSASNFKRFSLSLKQFFPTVGLNNFGNKIPYLAYLYVIAACCVRGPPYTTSAIWLWVLPDHERTLVPGKPNLIWIRRRTGHLSVYPFLFYRAWTTDAQWSLHWNPELLVLGR